ncbi:MAG: transcription antitermination factor NusB [Firmicutes bacterium HGW-Firmicutes-9]|jgi:N utilization substance protein B|nr:MAG: transcription antitermination factor NusB [Firmicutes bacterium HGW-Firmicutes-9]
MSRTTAREVAMMIHFSNLLGGEDTPEHVCEKAELLGTPLDEEDLLYVNQMLEGVKEHTEEIDEFVSRYSKDWMIDRIARVDLSILRVAIYEMLYRKEDVPTGAAINEAVELAKRYGGERSYAFVNGILGSVAKELVLP